MMDRREQTQRLLRVRNVLNALPVAGRQSVELMAAAMLDIDALLAAAGDEDKLSQEEK